MLGYLGQAPLVDVEWHMTGDLGLMRTDGAVEYHGRADDVLTAGGFRVSPIEVEEAMLALPALQEAAAVDFQLGPETRVIKLYFTASGEIDEAALKGHAAAHLAVHKRPRLFERLDHLPRNPNGKLLRKALRAANEAL
jgi:acyl-coenzyme A synthetase/AMP-(fatty) acid ligase